MSIGVYAQRNVFNSMPLLWEFAARISHHSEDKFGTNPDFLARIAKLAHLSVFEHGRITLSRVYKNSMLRAYLQKAPFVEWVNDDDICTCNARHLYEYWQATRDVDFYHALAMDDLSRGYLLNEVGIFRPLWKGEMALPPDFMRVDVAQALAKYRVANVSLLTRDSHNLGAWTFYIEDISRVALDQLVRHRPLSFTVQSQRFVDQAEGTVVLPWTLSLEHNNDVREQYMAAVESAFATYQALRAVGVPKEDARYVLPQGITTTVVVTIPTPRAFDHLVQQRTHRSAQREIRQIVEVMQAMRQIS